MSLRIASQLVEAIRAQGRASYPQECCGLLLGRAGDGAKSAADLRPMRNTPARRTTRLSPVQRLTQVAEQVRRWMGEDPEPKEIVAEKVTEKVTPTESVKSTKKVRRSLREEVRQHIEQHRQQRQQSRHSHGIGH